MEYKYYIVSTPNDFYMSEAVCRELEKTGASCYFNLRDSKKKDKKPDKYTNIELDGTIIAIVNEEFINNSHLKNLISTYSSTGWLESSKKVYILPNESISNYPKEWKKINVVDATKGLNQGIISQIISGEGTVVETSPENPTTSTSIDEIPLTEQVIEEAPQPKSQEASEIEVKKETSSVNETLGNGFSISSGEDKRENSESNIKEKLEYNRKDETRVQDNKTSLAQSSDSTGNLNSDGADTDYPSVNDSKDKIVDRVRKSILSLDTIMTKKPKFNNEIDCVFDRVSEAYLVPLYVFPFERCDEILCINDLFNSIEDPSRDIQRAFRSLVGDGVPKDEARAFKLFDRATKENPEDRTALYCLAVCNESGIGTEKDLISACYLYEKAYKLGYMPAGSRYAALMVANGNIDKAKAILREARNSNDLEASYLLGIISEDEGDLDAAYEYYFEAAEEGHNRASNALAYMYYNGIGVKQDRSMALQWIEKINLNDFSGAAYNALVHKFNTCEKADFFTNYQEKDELLVNEIIKPYSSLFNELEPKGIYLKLPAMQYNIAILVRRSNDKIDAAKSWLEGLPKQFGIPYVEEFYKYYEAEKKRRKTKAVGVSLLNGLANILTKGEAGTMGGGLFDKHREI